MAAVSASPLPDTASDVNKLTYEIFSILENNFLFGYDNPKFPKSTPLPADKPSKAAGCAGKVRILSIDGGGATDGLLAARSLAQLESVLRRKSGDPDARIADFFDVAAGTGSGGLLAALLFTRSKDDTGSPLLSAEGALRLLAGRRRKSSGILRRFSRAADKELAKAFGDGCTMKDTVKPVLIPCYDLSSDAPFVFSRADALKTDGYDFRMRDVCAATSAAKPVEVKSVDGRTRILAVDGRVAMNNPTAAAITHVLNNKQEFPFCNGVEDLLVLSLGNGGSDFGSGSTRSGLCRIAEHGASDLVDQAVSMAFGQSLGTNYVRIQALGAFAKEQASAKRTSKSRKTTSEVLDCVEAMLAQKYVKSVMFQGKKMAEDTNLDRIDNFAGEMIKEEERRKTSILPPVVLKQGPHHYSPSPRTSSATTLSSISSS